MPEYKLPDPKKGAGKALGLGLIAGVGLLAYYYLLPFLLTIVWGTVQLAIGSIVAGILLFILLSPKFWKRTGIILEALGELLFRGFVEMNPFAIMELQINRSEKDREDLKTQIERLKGQEDSLKQSLAAEKDSFKLSAEKMTLCQTRITKNPTDFEAPMELESATNDWSNSKTFIESVTPVYTDIQNLVIILDKSYRKSEYALKDARNTVRKQRATYEAVTAGSGAMKKALRAFTGDPEINKAASIALEALKKDISNKIGTIKNNIEITSRLMNERDLNDAAKVSLALKQAEAVDANFEVVSTVINNPDLQRIPTTGQENRWLKQLKK